MNIRKENELKQNETYQAYLESKKLRPLFSSYGTRPQLPLTYQDSLSPFPNYPSCAIGILTAKGQWGCKKGTAFVVEDSYLLTCASNCYSEVYGLYPNIDFTINSNRISGQDSYKISKAFIPQLYKILPQKERNQYNYALLQIEGAPNLKDKYGKIGIVFKNDSIVPTYQGLVLSSYANRKDNEQSCLQSSSSIILSGYPLIQKEKACGLIFLQQKNIQPSFIPFSYDMHSQLTEWVQIQQGLFCLGLKNYISFDADCLRDLEKHSIRSILLNYGSFACGAQTFFDQLPFSHVSQLYLSEIKMYEKFRFLNFNKFRNLKTLSLTQDNIKAQGCQLIASLPFSNLRQLDLSNNPIQDQGCRHIAKAQWQFLTSITLKNCCLTSKSIQYLTIKKRRNLSWLALSSNELGPIGTNIQQLANFPRIYYLDLSDSNFKFLDLAFLKSSWTNIKQLTLSKNRLGWKACKIIKKSGLILETLALWCDIDSKGAKWLYKSNLTRLYKLNLMHNAIGNYECLLLAKTNMAYIQRVQLDHNKIGKQGMSWLLQANWGQQAIEEMMVCLQDQDF